MNYGGGAGAEDQAPGPPGRGEEDSRKTAILRAQDQIRIAFLSRQVRPYCQSIRGIRPE